MSYKFFKFISNPSNDPDPMYMIRTNDSSGGYSLYNKTGKEIGGLGYSNLKEFKESGYDLKEISNIDSFLLDNQELREEFKETLKKINQESTVVMGSYRLPVSVHAKIKEMAHLNHRTIKQEIAFRIEKSLEPEVEHAIRKIMESCQI